MFIVIKYVRRNDGDRRYGQEFIFKGFDNKHNALAYILKECKEHLQEETKEKRKLFYDNLKDGGSAWIWEYERIGNGDLWKIIETNSLADFNFYLDVESSKDFDEL